MHKPSPAIFGAPLALADDTVAVPHETGVLLVADRDVIDLEGDLWSTLVPRLDGRRTASEMIAELRDRFPPARVLAAIGLLERDGRLRSVLPPAPAANIGLPRVEAPARVEATAPVSVHRLGTQADAIARALAEFGVTVVSTHAELHLAIVDDYLALANAAVTSLGRPWLPVSASGPTLWLGPLFVPDRGGCWRCLEHRLLRNREAHALLGPTRPAARASQHVRCAAQFCALQIRRWLDDPDSVDHPLLDTLMTIEPSTLEVTRHTLTRRPQCPGCGSGTLAEPMPIRIGHQPRSRPVGEEARALSAEAVLARWAHHVSPITGLVSALEQVAGAPVHVWRARYARPRPAKSWSQVVDHHRNVAAGKGLSALYARTGALAEALERYSASWDGTEPVTVASVKELGERAVHPNDSMLFSERQLVHGSVDHALKNRVPRPLDGKQRLSWLRAWSLTREDWRYVAAATALMGFSGVDAQFCVGDSNGNAAGATIEDAVLQGLHELIERDAAAVWWFNRVRRPEVLLDGIAPEYVARLAAHYRTIGREFWVLDLTTDLGVPACAAVSRRIDGAPAHPVVAFGSHLDPRVAVLRALTEMNQMLPHALARAPREDRPASPNSPGTGSMDLATLDGHDYLLPDRTQAPVDIEVFRTPREAGVDEQIDWCRRRIESQGLEVVLLELTRPDVGMPVVRTIVPGLRHFWRRLAPGRLYDVPVQMGWCTQVVAEDAINPLDLAV